jgi:hypothetical protein
MGLRRQDDEQRQQRGQRQRSIEYAVFIYHCTEGMLRIWGILGRRTLCHCNYANGIDNQVVAMLTVLGSRNERVP